MRKIILAVLGLAALSCPAATQVALVSEGPLDPPAAYGLGKLRESLAAKGLSVERTGNLNGAQADFIILAGLSSSASIAAAMADPPSGPEALAIRRTTIQGKPALILCGSDARGLMYAALDTADRVSLSTRDPLGDVRDISESPYLTERGISNYTMQRAYFESRLYDENYWKRYFDLLARSRINAFTVIFGYENGGFMAPLYPYFFDVEGYPEVRLVGIDRNQQARNTAAFRAMIRIAHERGIDVIPAVWDHIYRGGVQGGGIEGASDLAGRQVPGLVTGVTAGNLAGYTQAALRRFLEVFPDIDGLEFRMHNESGLKREEMAGFWHEVFTNLARVKPGLRLTLRAKELPDEIIDDALRLGLNARIETKYWMEQMGMPFHPTHVNRQNQHDRRHGYADLLRYPQRYRVHWRLWSGGTTRLLLWADPDYVRRFAESARLYDGNSIDVNEMLATKMLGEPHDKPPMPILNAGHRYYDYEFERYWHFYQVWGRVAYNPLAPADIWEREFQQRFGAAGVYLMKGLHEASRVLPRIVASSYRYQLFPTTRGWAEMMRQGDLPPFADLEGTDIEQFQNPRDAARSIIHGSYNSKRRPQETSVWFGRTAKAVLRHIQNAEAAGAAGKEARSTITDLKILAWLANYYSARLRAAVFFNIYRETKSLAPLDQAIERERSAISAWEQIVKAAGDIYAPDLAFGVHRVGFPRHWREELEKLQSGLEQLIDLRKNAKPGYPFKLREPAKPFSIRLESAGSAQPGKDFRITARPNAAIRSMRLRYRHLTQYEDYQSVDMTLHRGVYTASIPAAFIDPQWDLIYFVEAIDRRGNGRNFPDLEHEAPYVIVPVARQTQSAGSSLP